MAAYVPLNERALEAFDVLAAGGMPATTHRAQRFLACFRRESDAASLLAELDQIRDAGQRVGYHPVTGWRVRAMEPALSDQVGAAVQIHGQRYLHPPEFVWSLALAVRDRGGEVIEGVDVTDLRARAGRRRRRHSRAASAVPRRRRDRHGRLAGNACRAVRGAPTGAGRTRLQLQRAGGADAARPALLPGAAGRAHAAGQSAAGGRDDGVPAPRRSARPSPDRRDRRRRPAVPDRCGPRRPTQRVGRLATVHPRRASVVGRTASPRVFVAGGHGMWGIALGPLTGQLLAQTVVKGEAPAELAPFDPLR